MVIFSTSMSWIHLVPIFWLVWVGRLVSTRILTWHPPPLPIIPCTTRIITFQGTNISHLGKRKIIFKMQFFGDMLIPWRVSIFYKGQSPKTPSFRAVTGYVTPKVKARTATWPPFVHQKRSQNHRSLVSLTCREPQFLLDVVCDKMEMTTLSGHKLGYVYSRVF